MDIKDLVSYAIQGDSEGFQNAFSSIIDNKAEDAIAQKYDDMYGAAVEEAIDELEIEETVNPPKSEDEQAFVDKHVVDKKDHPEAEEDQFTSNKKKTKRTADREEGEDEAVYEELDEATFKPGNMKMKDGSSVKISMQDAKTLSTLFSELTGSNKKKMEDRMMSGKKGFEEILKFAKEAM